jgi:branched-subunit amino acid transport protein
MNGGWIVIAVLTVVTFAIKAAGPLAVGGRELPEWAMRLIVLLPAALLAALVVVQAATSGPRLVLDGRLAGLAVAAVALALRAPFIVVLLLAGVAGALVHVLAG